MNQIAVAGVARVMVDVDPGFRVANRVAGGAEAVLGRGVECDRRRRNPAVRWRSGELFAARKETVFFEQSILVPDRHLLAEHLE